MSTRLVQRGGGSDRTGLDNLLGTNGHPMNGLAYTTSLLGGSLLGVLPLTEGRYACFFREFNEVEGGSVVESTNRVLLVSTVSGGSRIIELGVEDRDWRSFDSSEGVAYLLTVKDGQSSVVVIKGDTDHVYLLSENDVPQGTTESGQAMEFNNSLSVVAGSLMVMSTSGGLFLARIPQNSIHQGGWEFYSENTITRDSSGLRPQRTTKGQLVPHDDVHLMEVRNTQYLFDREQGGVLVYKRDRSGVWEEHKIIDTPVYPENVIGFCLVKTAPAYSEPKSLYTFPAVFSVKRTQIDQYWVSASIS